MAPRPTPYGPAALVIVTISSLPSSPYRKVNMPIKSRTRFNQAISEGASRSPAAKRAHVRSRATAQRWEKQYHLSRARALKADQEAETRLQAARVAQVEAAKASEVNRLAAEAHRLSPEGQAEEAARKAADPRCSTCGYPAGSCSHSGPDFATKLAAHLANLRSRSEAAALVNPEDPRITNAVGDPHGRTDVNPVEAAEAWSRYRAENPLPERPDDGVWTESGGLITNRMRWEAEAKLKAVQDEEPNESDY